MLRIIGVGTFATTFELLGTRITYKKTLMPAEKLAHEFHLAKRMCSAARQPVAILELTRHSQGPYMPRVPHYVSLVVQAIEMFKSQ